ncbi:MAG: CdiI family contact-dependent growth inhibition immunity protein [Burkholderiales bacterium]|nr:CdiI family contact-dependent growth inhibition immunity protein [Burkholderiales bacterium]
MQINDYEAISKVMAAKQGRQAVVTCNPKFILVKSMSGRGVLSPDPEGVKAYHEPSVEAEILGSSIIAALDSSRFFDHIEIYEYNKGIVPRFEAWVAEVMERFGYKKRVDIFQYMFGCQVKMMNDKIKLMPTKWKKNETSHIMGDQYQIILPATSTPEEIGAAVRRALDSAVAGRPL